MIADTEQYHIQANFSEERHQEDGNGEAIVGSVLRDLEARAFEVIFIERPQSPETVEMGEGVSDED